MLVHASARAAALTLGARRAAPSAFFDENRTGELVNRLADDCSVLQSTVTSNVSMALRQLLQLLGSLAIIFFISWRLTLVMLAVVPVVTVGAVRYGRSSPPPPPPRVAAPASPLPRSACFLLFPRLDSPTRSAASSPAPPPAPAPSLPLPPPLPLSLSAT